MDSKSKRRILLVDDDRSLLTTLGDFLQFEGYEVITADSGEEGLRRLTGVTPDLIILDMSMPGMGGVGFLKAITGSDGRPKHPVLVLTARANMAEFFANVPVDGFVAKPCDPNDLLMEVSRILFLRGSAAEKETGGNSGPLVVLLGEDDPVVRDSIRRNFSSEGIAVENVEKGPEVLEKAILRTPDVVLLKLVLSGMNGDTVARMLKDMPKTSAIPVILYDSEHSTVPDSRFVREGSNIMKFVRSTMSWELLAAVREVVRG
jgi:CheY-like chemotaxis protein